MKGNNILTLGIITILFNIGTHADARPMVIHVSSQIGSSDFAGEVVISKDSKTGKIRLHSIEFPDTLISYEGNWPFEEGYRVPYLPGEDRMTGNWPAAGDTVFIVLRSKGNTPLFGKRLGAYYRLWYPGYPGSIAVFNFESPLLVLSKDDQLVNPLKKDSSDTTNFSCWDGCLLPISQTRDIIQKYRLQFSEAILKSDLAKFMGKSPIEITYDKHLHYYSDFEILSTNNDPASSIVLYYADGKKLLIVMKTICIRPIAETSTSLREMWQDCTIESLQWQD